MSSEKRWFTLADVAAALHVSEVTARRLVRPHRARCHLSRIGRHPRLHLHVPAAAIEELVQARPWYAPGAAA